MMSFEQSNVQAMEWQEPALGYLYNGPEMLDGLSRTSRGEPSTFGSTPFNAFLPSIIDQQRTVIEHNDAQFQNVPKGVRPELAAEAIDFNYGRVHHRTEKNFESFECREYYSFDRIPEELRETAQRVITGHGSPAENILIADILGMPTVELASTTHAYGRPERMKYLQDQRLAVEEAITFHDGTIIRSQKNHDKATWSRADHFQIKGECFKAGTNRDASSLDGLRMTRTRTVGQVGLYRIYERSSFILDISKLPVDFMHQLQAIDITKPEKEEQMLAIPGFYAAIKDALRNDDYTAAIPIATTAWGVHENGEQIYESGRWRVRHLHSVSQSGQGRPLNAQYELLGLSA